MVVIGQQLRAARALARMEQADLATRAGVSLGTIKRLEATVGPVSANVITVDAVVRALEVAGVIFTPENGDGPGVRLRKRIPAVPFTILEFARILNEFERSRLTEIRETLQAPNLTLERHLDGVNLKATTTSGSIGTIRLVEGTLVFEPDLENGRDWTSNDWLTPNELARWVRETWRGQVRT